jgi:hypothetical protein
MNVTDPYPITRDAYWTRERRYGPAEYDGEMVTVVAALRKLRGNERPYFSLTYSAGESGGANHDVCVGAFPDTAPVALVHLSDDHGVPMHAIANGLYWLGLMDFPDARNLETFAKHLRVDPTVAAEIDAYVSGPAGGHQPVEALRYMVNALLLPERWRAEAAAALAVILGDES